MGEPNGKSPQGDLSPQQLRGKSISEHKPFRPKELPSFRSVLKPSAAAATKPRADLKPAPLVPPATSVGPQTAGHGPTTETNSTAAGSTQSDDLLVKLLNNHSISALNPPGKFSNSATDSGDLNGSEHDSHEHGSHVQSPLRHRKPRFAQIIKSTDSSRQAPSPANKLNELLEEEFNANENEQEDSGKVSVTKEIPGLECLLLPHQVHGVKFMCRRENSKTHARGGLLCDEMGLGKTVQSIALMLSRPPAKDAKIRTTLIVAPLAVMSQWVSEIYQMAPGLKVCTHQGQRRVKDIEKLRAFDAVVTTYETVTSEMPRGGALHQGAWYRIIADEAHTFRNPKTQLSLAMLRLKSDGQRWALTGTPVHNSIVDLYTLLGFIGIEEFSSQADLKGLISTTKSSDGRVSEPLLKEARRYLKTFMLRRTQRVLAKLLPPIETERRPIHLNSQETAAYDEHVPIKGIETGMVMAKIIRLRQACNGMLSEAPSVRHSDKLGIPGQEGAAPARDSPLSSTKVTEFESSAEVGEDDMMSHLLKNLSLDRESAKNDPKANYRFRDSSKVQEVSKILTENRTRKTVVFSSFVTMLHVLTPMLEYEGIRYELYHGGLSADQRRAMIAKFKDEKEGVIVLLCSLQAAAVGLNLTMASQVIFIEPWWNPQIVDQAAKRVHRLGQKEKVRCIELYAANVIDERMLVIQDKKRQLAKHLVDGGETLDQTDRDYLYYGDNVAKKESEKPEVDKTTTNHESEANLADRKMKDLPKIRKHIVFE